VRVLQQQLRQQQERSQAAEQVLLHVVVAAASKALNTSPSYSREAAADTSATGRMVLPVAAAVLARAGWGRHCWGMHCAVLGTWWYERPVAAWCAGKLQQ
jgi:hypothetical protein